VQRLSWWVEWPQGPIRTGVVFLVALATVVVVARLPTVVRQLEDDVANNSALSYSDREIAGGNGVVVDQAAVYAARARIPEDETYHVAVASDYPHGTEVTVPAVESYYQYFLMPRRPADDARWIVCYGCDVVEVEPRTEVVWRGAYDISIVRVDR
jgi:membrane protein implicated in regulation of membrane protease activity